MSNRRSNRFMRLPGDKQYPALWHLLILVGRLDVDKEYSWDYNNMVDAEDRLRKTLHGRKDVRCNWGNGES